MRVRGELLNTLAWSAYYRDQPENAIDYMRQALLVNEEVHSPQGPIVALTKHNLAIFLIAAGDINEAERVINEAIAIFEETTEKDFWRLSNSLGVLGAVRMYQGRFKEAERLMLDGLQGTIVGTGPDTVYARSMREYLVELYERWGKPELADRYRSPQPH